MERFPMVRVQHDDERATVYAEGGIDFGPNGFNEYDPYKRVMEAELAAEVKAQIERGTRYPTTS
jgi:hypothetical protein